MSGLGFGVWGVGCGVRGLGFGVRGLGFGVGKLGLGVWGLGFWDWFSDLGIGFGVWSSGSEPAFPSSLPRLVLDHPGPVGVSGLVFGIWVRDVQRRF